MVITRSTLPLQTNIIIVRQYCQPGNFILITSDGDTLTCAPATADASAVSSNVSMKRKKRKFYSRWKATVRPAITMLTILISLISMLSDGPEVSLNGSPTVSPTTVA